MRPTAVLIAAALLAGCGGEAPREVPPPIELTREHVGYYCNMIVADHRGPKGQVHLLSARQPLWFASVRDTLAFTRLPGEPTDIAAIYVNDMGRADWDSPEAGTWIDARAALFVVGSRRAGGMGAPEPVPFAERAAAEGFASTYGGRVVSYGEVPDEHVLAVPPPAAAVPAIHAHARDH